jgi:hypothetical protein
MEDVVISLLAPVEPQRVQRWVEEVVDGVRAQARASGVRLGRLVRSTPAEGGDWLIDVHREDRSVELEQDVLLATIMTGMALLGLRPYLFVISREPGARRSREAHPSGADARRRQPARHGRPACRRPV